MQLLQCKLKQNVFLNLVKSIEYSVSVINIVSSKPHPGLLPRTEIYFLLWTCADELLSLPNIRTFLPNPLPSDNEKDECTSNPIIVMRVCIFS